LQPEFKPSPLEKLEEIQVIIATDYIRFFEPDFSLEEFRNSLFSASNRRIGLQFNNRAVLNWLSNKHEEAMNLLVKAN